MPDFESDRDELFGKLTVRADRIAPAARAATAPRSARNGHQRPTAAAAGSTSQGSEATLDIGIVEGSWVINERSFASFKFTDFANENSAFRTILFGFDPAARRERRSGHREPRHPGLHRPCRRPELNAFHRSPTSSATAFWSNGDAGRRRPGRRAAPARRQRLLPPGATGRLRPDVRHAGRARLHFGAQWNLDEEDLAPHLERLGHGHHSRRHDACPAVSSCAGQRIFFQAAVLQQGLALPSGVRIPIIHSEYESLNFEVNDSDSLQGSHPQRRRPGQRDRLYGQGLRENADNVSGFEVARGHKYRMHEIEFADALQPRLGAVWAYGDVGDGLRELRALRAGRELAAARGLLGARLGGPVDAYFDHDGKFIGSSPEASSSGKFFDEISIRAPPTSTCSARRGSFGRGWTARAHVRYRYSYNFWEDTEQRLSRCATILRPASPASSTSRTWPRSAARSAVGYVVAELDNAFTQVLGGRRRERVAGRAGLRQRLLLWSHYYGNVDQDNSA